jgi:hypothetical protein
MTATLAPVYTRKQSAPLAEEVRIPVTAAPEHTEEVAVASGETYLLPCATQSALSSSLAGALIGMLAASGSYLSQDWHVLPAASAVLLTTAAIVGVWLTLLLRQPNE